MDRLAQESDAILVWPAISTAIRPAASGLDGWTAVRIPSLSLQWAAATRPTIRTRVHGEQHSELAEDIPGRRVALVVALVAGELEEPDCLSAGLQDP